MTNDQKRTPSRVGRGVPTGGQFAASAKGEAGLDLDVEQPFSDLAKDSAAALDAAFPGGRAMTHGPESLTYEDAQGNSYTVRFRNLSRGESVNVSPDDSYGYPTTAHRMTDVDGFIDSDDVVDAVGRVLEGAHKRRAFRETLDEAVARTTDDPTFSAGDGSTTWAVNGDYAYTFGSSNSDDYVRFGHFDYSPGMARPDRNIKDLDMVQFSLGSHPEAAQEDTDPDRQGFEVRRTADRVHYLDGNGQRLAPWQVTALEAELARRGAPSPAAVLNHAHHVGTQRLAEDKGTLR